jgi:toxin CcdB
MPQFDVYKNNNKNTKNAFPYLVDIQHQIISDLATRLVIPMGKFDTFADKNIKRLTPLITFDDQQYLLLTPQLTSIPSYLLKDSVGTIEMQRDLVINALDFAITGI